MEYESLCEALRERFALQALPVDVAALARGLGLTIIEKRWRGRPHAASVIRLNLIILNSNRPEPMRRFDLAHELGHFVLNRAPLHTDAENRFAAALLMPRRDFERAVIQHGADGYCSRLFLVSERAVQLRLQELQTWRG